MKNKLHRLKKRLAKKQAELVQMHDPYGVALLEFNIAGLKREIDKCKLEGAVNFLTGLGIGTPLWQRKAITKIIKTKSVLPCFTAEANPTTAVVDDIIKIKRYEIINEATQLKNSGCKIVTPTIKELTEGDVNFIRFERVEK